MTIPTTPKTTFIALAEPVEQDDTALRSRSSPLIVSFLSSCGRYVLMKADAKQARDLIAVLTESKQSIDPRLAEMARYSGGGGGGRGYGGRGGHRGGRGGYTASNSAPLGRSRW
jgi:hypothetical protein